MASNIKVDIVRPTATNGSLSLKGDSGGSATTNGISVDSSGDTSITGTTTTSTASLDGAVTINDSGADVDFRVEGAGQANALFVQGSDGNVGIGTNTPDAPLTVSSTNTPAVSIGGNSAIQIDVSSATSPSIIAGGSSNYDLVVGSWGDVIINADENDSSDQNIIFKEGTTEHMRISSSGVDVTGAITTDGANLDGAVTINDSGADADFRVESDTVDHALFVQGSDGYVGIGVSSPADKLHVDGNIRLTSNGGINFSAYATSGNPSSNLLDDYEEGTFDFSIRGTAGSGYYTKVGRICHVNMAFSGTAGSVPSNNISLPFTHTGGDITVGDSSFPTVAGSVAYGKISSGNNYLVLLDPTVSNTNSVTFSFSFVIRVV